MNKRSNSELFNKYLYRTACICPTRLYYKNKKDYPENDSDNFFIQHVKINKLQLRELAKSLFPNGTPIDANNKWDASQQTHQLLQQDEITIYGAIIIVDGLFARIPILRKQGNKVDLYHVEAKAVNGKKLRITNSNGLIYPKWLNYLRGIAFNTHVFQKKYPDFNPDPHLVFSDKSQEIHVDHLNQYFRFSENGRMQSDRRSLSEIDDVQHIFKIVPVKKYVKKIWKGEGIPVSEKSPFNKLSFGRRIEEFASYYRNGKKFPVTIGDKCRDCEYRIKHENLDKNQKSGFEACWHEALDEEDRLGEPHVFDLIGHGTRAYMQEGIYWQADVPLEKDISSVVKILKKNGKITTRQRQALQVLKLRRKEVPREIVRSRLFYEMDKWEYPLHFLDFEAATFAIPIRAGRKPYDPVVFQFSCHTIYKDGTIRHNDWIQTNPDIYPNYELVRKLKALPDFDRGTILQYSPFEKHMLKKIRRQLKYENGRVPDREELMNWIETIIRRPDSKSGDGPFMVDMNRLVKDYYYNREMENSLSIKKVLPAILTVSPVLKDKYGYIYHSNNFSAIRWWQHKPQNGQAKSPYRIIEMLGEGINHGAEAMVAYVRLLQEEISDEEKKGIEDALLKYCELDTLAMVMIFEHWLELKKNQK